MEPALGVGVWSGPPPLVGDEVARDPREGPFVLVDCVPPIVGDEVNAPVAPTVGDDVDTSVGPDVSGTLVLSVCLPVGLLV